MKTNKLIAAAALIAVSATGLSYSYADEELSTTTTNTVKEFQKGKFERIELTDEQKAEMQAQREEKQAQRKAYNEVIDALLAGETLTDQQEIIRSEIIEKKAEMEAKRLEMEEKKAEIQAILEKVEAWETISDEEQTMLDTFKAEHKGKKSGKEFKRGGSKWAENMKWNRTQKSSQRGNNRDVDTQSL